MVAASAAFQPFGKGGIRVPRRQLFKPPGVPAVDLRDPDWSDCVMLAWDPGDGSGHVNLIDSPPGHAWYPPAFRTSWGGADNPADFYNCSGPAFPTQHGPYGPGIAWQGNPFGQSPPGASYTPCANITEGSSPAFDTLRAANDLRAAPLNSGCSIACCYQQSGPAQQASLFGRAAEGREAAQAYTFLLFTNGSSTSDAANRQVNFGWNNAVTAGTLTSTLNPPFGSLVVAVGSAQVTDVSGSPHKSTCKLFVNGTDQGTATNQVVIDSFNGDPDYPSNGDVNESQPAFGGSPHLTVGSGTGPGFPASGANGGSVFFLHTGNLFWGAIFSGPKTQAQAQRMFINGVWPSCCLPLTGSFERVWGI